MNKPLSALALALALLLAACAPAAGNPSAGPEQTPAAESSQPPAAEPIQPGGSLVSRDDYGTLIPYVGERVFDQWSYGEYYMRGLMTLDGTPVTQPVYARAEPMRYYDQRGADTYHTWNDLPVYLLAQGVPEGGGTFSTDRLGAAALDGSWCTGLTYTHYAPGEDGFLLADDERLELWNFAGQIEKQWSLSELGYSQANPPSWGYGVPDAGLSWHDGMLLLNFQYRDEQPTDGNGAVTYLNTGTGELLTLDAVYPGSFREGLSPWPEGDLYGYVDKDGAWAIPAQYSNAQPFCGGMALVSPTWDTFALIDRTGAALLSGEGRLYRIESPDGEWYASWTGDNTITAVYGETLSPMDSPAIGRSGVFPGDGGLLYWRGDDGFHLWSPGQGERVVPSQADYMSLVSGLVWTSDQALYTLDGDALVPPGVYTEIPPFPCRDPITGEAYLVAYRDGGQDLLALDGAVLGSTDHRPSYDSEERQSIFLTGGLVECIGADSAAYLDRAGNAVYTCPLAPLDGKVPG